MSSRLTRAHTVGGAARNLEEGDATAWLEVDNQIIKRGSSAPTVSSVDLAKSHTWKSYRAPTTEGYTLEEKAATRIWRAWQRSRQTGYMHKNTFTDRLDLEDAVGKGVVRLAVYSLMFVFIVFSLEVGVPDSVKLDAKHLISDELHLDDLYNVKTLQGLRDFLPVLSDGFKRFSSSSNNRFSREDGYIVAQKRVELVRSKTLFSFDPEVTGGSFTLASWVERMSGSKNTGRISLLRKPMQSDRSLNCWGWFIKLPEMSPQLRFGAHDFHSLDESVVDGEEVVGLPGQYELGEGLLAHEVVVVNGLTVTFYRDGKRIGEAQRMARPLTDCINPDSIELGDARLAMSTVKFYSRALSDSEVEEMFQGGAPLVDVATGSKLTVVEEDELLQVGVEVTDGTKQTLNALELEAEISMVASKVGLSAEDIRLAHFSLDPNFPPDPSPAAVLGKGSDPSVVAMLPDYEKASWEQAGMPTTGSVVGSWAEDDALDSTPYWSVVDLPMHGDGTPAGRLPVLEEDTAGIALSFWFKSYELRLGKGPNVAISREAQDGFPAMNLEFQLELDWVWISLSVDGVSGFVWSFLTAFDEETGRIKEDFLLYAFAQNPSPLVWRHMLLQYNGATRRFEFFLDGEKVIDDAYHYTLPKYTSWDDVPTDDVWNPRRVFSNASLTPHAWTSSSWSNIPGKIAQFRFYPRLLSQEEIRTVHEEAVWPLGTAVRQCSRPAEDFDLADTVEVDGKGHSCAWYATVEKHSPYICAQTWAKNMCPVTCAGKRLCHDGSLLQSRQPPAPRRRFRIFDRITHIKPLKPASKGGSTSVICPSDRVSRETVLRECEEWRQRDIQEAEDKGRGLYNGQFTSNFTRLYARTFSLTKPADIRDCEILAERMDEEQCQWNSSWMEDFEADYAETKTWSLSFWLKPKEQSLGMPNNFWFAVNFFSTMAPPLVLSHWNEIQPTLEPWMDAYTTIESGGSVSTKRAAIWPTVTVDYAGSWTFFHMQLEPMEDGQVRLCATLNAIPLSCDTFAGTPTFQPRHFLEGIEFTTEMLVSPIELATERLSPSQLQNKYYRRVTEMEKVFGPKGGKTLRSEPKVSQPFDNKLVLMAPPVVFQTRRMPAQCKAGLTAPIVSAQLDLLEAAHCSEAICVNVDKTSLVTCRGEIEDGSFFGRSLSTLGGNDGHADFLYTIADNPVLVRNGTLLEAERFIDTQTSTASVVAVFQDPSTGLISQVALRSELTGKTVSTHALFSHYGFVAEDERRWLKYNYGMLFALVFCAVIANLHFLYDLHRHAKRASEKIDTKGVLEVAYDLVMAALVAAFGIVALVSADKTESKALDFVHRIANIPFASPGVPFEEKVSDFFESIDVLNAELAEAHLLSVVAFGLMVLMLIRIVHATGVHPRLKVLVGTLYHAMTDLWHFAMLMVVVFFFFSFTAKWMFSKDREDFRDLRASMKTQFEVLMGRTPKDFENEARLAVFISLTIVVQFFLMRHFLLAIIMQGYLKLRKEVEENDAEQGFIEDVFYTMDSWVRSKLYQWPSRRRVSYILRKRIGSRKITFSHLRIQMPDVSGARLRGFWDYYSRMEWLRCAPPDHLLPPSKYDLGTQNNLLRKELDSMQQRVSWLEAEKSAAEDQPRTATTVRKRSLPSAGLIQSLEAPSPQVMGAGVSPQHRTPRDGNGNGNGHRLTPAQPVVTPFEECQGIYPAGLELQDLRGFQSDVPLVPPEQYPPVLRQREQSNEVARRISSGGSTHSADSQGYRHHEHAGNGHAKSKQFSKRAQPAGGRKKDVPDTIMSHSVSMH